MLAVLRVGLHGQERFPVAPPQDRFLGLRRQAGDLAEPDRAGIDAPPRDATNHRAVAEYNEKVAAYNKVAPAFNACVKDYAARAQNDVTRINAALRDANSQ